MSDLAGLRLEVIGHVESVDYRFGEYAQGLSDFPNRVNPAASIFSSEWKAIRAELIRLQGERDALARRISEPPQGVAELWAPFKDAVILEGADVSALAGQRVALVKVEG